MYEYHILDNGLKIILSHTPSRVVYSGVYVGVGSRHEEGADEGMAHFIEHSLFKGTEHRKAYHILNRIDGVGGELNAFTTKEETCVYASSLKEHLGRCLELFADILFHSTFPLGEIEREKDVVLEEINAYNDTPAELIYDQYEELAFEGHPLAHNILGTKRNVKRFTPERLRAFMRSRYTPDRMVVTVSGDVKMERLVKLCERYFGGECKGVIGSDRECKGVIGSAGECWGVIGSDRECKGVIGSDRECMGVIGSDRECKGVLGSAGECKGVLGSDRECMGVIGSDRECMGVIGSDRECNPQFHLFDRHINRHTHQAHLLIGCEAPDVYHADKTAFTLLNNILGGPAMNSRLNVAVRERYGFCYSIESQYVPFSDTGLFYIYAGVDLDAEERARSIIVDELRRMTETPLTERQLRQAQRQMMGQMAINDDFGMNEMQSIGKAYLCYDHVNTLEEMEAELMAVTADDLLRVAGERFVDGRMSTLAYK